MIRICNQAFSFIKKLMMMMIKKVFHIDNFELRSHSGIYTAGVIDIITGRINSEVLFCEKLMRIKKMINEDIFKTTLVYTRLELLIS